jgi:hypothetical protein
VVEFLAVLLREARDASGLDLHGERELVRRLERRRERGHLVEQAAERPDVALLVVRHLVHLGR